MPGSFIVSILLSIPHQTATFLLVSCGRSDMHPASEPSTFVELVFYLAFGIVLLIIGAIHAAPTLLAFRRDHPNRWIILVINVAFGGTIIGWGIGLVWAMRAAHRVGSTSSGGESGLNLSSTT